MTTLFLICVALIVTGIVTTNRAMSPPGAYLGIWIAGIGVVALVVISIVMLISRI